MTKEEQMEMFNAYYMAGYPSRKASATPKPTYADLEKENKELKKEVELWKKASENNSFKAFQFEKENKELKDNFKIAKDNEYEYSSLLTKAKDHIKKLLDCLKQDTNDPQTNYYVCQYMDKAEQFLNSEVEK